MINNAWTQHIEAISSYIMYGIEATLEIFNNSVPGLSKSFLFFLPVYLDITYNLLVLLSFFP